MTQFLIRQFKDKTGHVHTDIFSTRQNETLTVVEEINKERALRKFERMGNKRRVKKRKRSEQNEK